MIAYVELVNPDGIPGTGDERYRTLSSGSTKLVLGSGTLERTDWIRSSAPRW